MDAQPLHWEARSGEVVILTAWRRQQQGYIHGQASLSVPSVNASRRPGTHAGARTAHACKRWACAGLAGRQASTRDIWYLIAVQAELRCCHARVIPKRSELVADLHQQQHARVRRLQRHDLLLPARSAAVMQGRRHRLVRVQGWVHAAQAFTPALTVACTWAAAAAAAAGRRPALAALRLLCPPAAPSVAAPPAQPAPCCGAQHRVC